jgi:hypothetical protein
MLNVYIETSGKAQPSDKDPFIITAVIIDAQQMESLNFGIKELKLLSLGFREQGFRIKTNDIIHGNGNLSGLSLERRKEMLDRMAKIVDISNSKIVFSSIKNKLLNRNPIETTLLNEETAFRELILRICLASRIFSDSEMRILLDRNQWAHDRHLLDGVTKLIFDLFSRMGPLVLNKGSIITPPILTTSVTEPFIDIVNFIAYTVRNIYSEIKQRSIFPFTSYFNIIQSKIYKGFDQNDPKAGIFEL